MCKVTYLDDCYTTDDLFMCDDDCPDQQGVSFTPETVVFDEHGNIICPDCNQPMEEYCGDGPSDYEERMEERRQMGLYNF